MGRPARRPPRNHVTSGNWPTAKLDGTLSAIVAQQVSANLAAATDALSLRAVEAATGVDHDTVARVLKGDVWCDIETLARLEIGLGTNLWPRHGESE